MKKEKYFPIALLERHTKENDRFKEKLFMGRTIEEYLSFILSDDFMAPSYKGRYEKVNAFAYVLARPYFEAAAKASSVKERNNFAQQAVTEARDHLSMGYLLELWGRTKQSYEMDPDFFRELMATKNVFVTENIGRHIPFQDFYLDFSKNPELAPICGGFVHICDGGQFAVIMATKEGALFSYYSRHFFENGVYEISNGLQPSTPFVTIDENGQCVNLGHGHADDQHPWQRDYRADIVRAITQVIMFLSSDEPDVTESELTKQTYRPSKEGTSTSKKHRFSDVRIWDVGYRYGKAIRLSKETEKEEKTDEDDNDYSSNGKSRRSPRPHVRCGHWHRYHCGVGRTELRWRWLPPSFISGKEVKGMSLVIHKVEK